MDLVDRKRGALIGLAVGDALGVPAEFEMPGQFPEIIDFRGGGPFRLDAGQWTDDTSMALALADSIAQAGWDLNDQMRRYLAWWRHGEYAVNGRCFDIGGTVQRALLRFQEHGDARTAGDPTEGASGNGSIMRLAPVPIRFAELFPDRLEELIEKAIESSITTHASPQCKSACAYMAVVLAALIHGRRREEVLAADWEPLTQLKRTFPLHPEVEEVVDGSFRRRHPPEIVGSAYVVTSLEAALWAFYAAADFRQALLRAVNLGDDADTTGAVCGQFAGAFWGASGIPEPWRQGLARAEFVESVLAGLLR